MVRAKYSIVNGKRKKFFRDELGRFASNPAAKDTPKSEKKKGSSSSTSDPKKDKKGKGKGK